MIEDLCQFLLGRTEPIVSRLRTEMDRAAGELKFERAAALRDQVRAIESVVEHQIVISPEYIDSDVALARSMASLRQVFFIAAGS
jgi:excinuclease ABC subunit C